MSVWLLTYYFIVLNTKLKLERSVSVWTCEEFFSRIGSGTIVLVDTCRRLSPNH